MTTRKVQLFVNHVYHGFTLIVLVLKNLQRQGNGFFVNVTLFTTTYLTVRLTVHYEKKELFIIMKQEFFIKN